MAESQEYNILKRYIPEFRTAVKPNLTSLGGRFVSSNLISPETDDELRNPSKSEEDRAAKLVSLLLDKVKLNKENYRKIIDILKTSGDHFNDLLSKLESPPEAQQKSGCVGDSQQTTFQASASATSDSRVPIGALGMTCGCGICISGLGCPNPLPSEIKFPLSDKSFGSLDDQEKKEFLFELRRETVQIMKKFYRLASELYNSINRGPRPVTVHDLRANLYEIKVYLDRGSKESIFDGYKEEFDRAQKMEEIFNVITEICSFLDYDLLENLTNTFGTEEDKERIAKYHKDFADYARRRTSIYECPCIEPADYTKWSDVYVKLDSKLEAKLDIEQLREFRHQISEILRINKAAIRFCCAQKGCIELKFQLPKFLEKAVVPLSFEETIQLKQLGVIYFSTSDYRCNIKISSTCNLNLKRMSLVKVSDANRAVDKIVRSLQEGDPGGTFYITEIVKAGSLGHGTAVPGNFDLDLVVYSKNLVGHQIVREGFDSALDLLERYLDRKHPDMLTKKERTSRSQQFTFDGMIEVDLLVSPYWGDHPRELYQFLQTINPSERSRFSVSASKWQVRFFSMQENQVKEFIRRAKVWRNCQEWGDRGKPKSYLLSVLVLRAYEISRSKLPRSDPSTREIATQTTIEMKSIVKNHARADIYWEEYYQKSTYPDLFPQHPPRIVDPANPANNLHETGISGYRNKKCRDYGDGDGDWGKFVQYVNTLDLNVPVEQWVYANELAEFDFDLSKEELALTADI